MPWDIQKNNYPSNYNRSLFIYFFQFDFGCTSYIYVAMVFGYWIVYSHLNCQFVRAFLIIKTKIQKRTFFKVFLYWSFKKVSIIWTPDSGSDPHSKCGSGYDKSSTKLALQIRIHKMDKFSTVTTIFQFYCLLKMVLVAYCVILFCFQSNRRTKIDLGIFLIYVFLCL